MESLELIAPAIFVASSTIVVVGALYWGIKSARRDRERVRQAALTLGLEYRDGEDAMRAAYEGTGKAARFAMYEKQPAFLRKFFAALGPWRLTGERDGLRIEIYEETRSTGKNSTTYTVARVHYPKPLPYELRAAKEGVFTKIGKAIFGLQDVEVGDPEFDREFRVKAGDPLAAKLLLGRGEIQRPLLEALRRYPAFRVESAFVHFEKVGIRTGAEELQAILEALLPAARAIGGST